MENSSKKLLNIATARLQVFHEDVAMDFEMSEITPGTNARAGCVRGEGLAPRRPMAPGRGIAPPVDERAYRQEYCEFLGCVLL